MGIFTAREARTLADPGVGAELTEAQRRRLPAGFESVGEALAAGSRSVVEACWVVGRDLAEVGASLGEVLEGLRSTTLLVRGDEPAFAEVHATSVAWSEGTLAFLHRLSCSDPMTGLASQAHLRERLAECYREVGDGAVRRAFALVVVEAAVPTDFVGHAQSMTWYGEMARSVFPGRETIGRVGVRRVVVIAPRDDQLALRVSLLGRMLAGRGVRVWIEGLPGTDHVATQLLDELARS
ncbi:hypothetical protein [Nocardioides sp. SYSU D00038]|uniref:hypothetical protein n=1 Tax=Nocardioides sp. SYSU D00038 TaxID=2812554 RepID=UPI0027DD1FFA|nr:hypothetical protein [Nocardioides sp. SYSU D00038]